MCVIYRRVTRYITVQLNTKPRRSATTLSSERYYSVISTNIANKIEHLAQAFWLLSSSFLLFLFYLWNTFVVSVSYRYTHVRYLQENGFRYVVSRSSRIELWRCKRKIIYGSPYSADRNKFSFCMPIPVFRVRGEVTKYDFSFLTPQYDMAPRCRIGKLKG